jgi:hypothetical protein
MSPAPAAQTDRPVATFAPRHPSAPTGAPTTSGTPSADVGTGAETGAGAVTGSVRWWLRAEGLAALAAACALYAGTGRGWGLFALLFLAPDLSFVGYLTGRRVGAAAYNALHSYVGPLALGLVGHAVRQPALLPFAYVWAAHIGFDRLVGYGLKYPSAFGDTHLGRTGPRRRAPRP